MLCPADLAGLECRLNAKLDQIQAALDQLLKGETMAQATLDDILAEATKQTTIGASVVALLQTLFALRNDPVKLQNAFNLLVQNDATIQAAITANTPPATATVPTPTVPATPQS